MSVWGELRKRSSGEVIRKEDLHISKVDITKCDVRGHRFPVGKKYLGKTINDDMNKNLRWYRLNFRFIDQKNYDEDHRRWYYFRQFIVVNSNMSNDMVKHYFNKYINEVISSMGEFDGCISDDQQLYWGDKNKSRISMLDDKIKEHNKNMMENYA